MLGMEVKFEDTNERRQKSMKDLELERVKKVSKKTIADFIRSETGSVGIKNAATIGAFAGALALSQSSSDATTLEDGTVVIEIAI